MTILRSPGCNCSCGCLRIEELDYNTAVAANTEHYIPHTVPLNCTVDLTKIIDTNYFTELTNQFQIKIKDISGTTTHETLTFDARRDTAVYDQDHAEIRKFPYDPVRRDRFFYAIPHYRQRGYKRYININVSSLDEDFESNAFFKILEVGDKLFRIKSVSAGTYNPKEGIAHARLEDFNQIFEAAHCSGLGTPSPAIIKLEKDRYVFSESDTSRVFNLFRFHRNDFPLGVLKSNVSFIDEQTVSWSDGEYQKTLSYTTSSSNAISVLTPTNDFQFENKYNNPWHYYLSATEKDDAASLLIVPEAPQTGDGHFELETYKINGLSGSSTTVKVFRTGGNSTAVDVVVAVGNSDVTLNFGVGEVVKTFVINHDTHDGETFVASMTPTNDLFPKRDVGGFDSEIGGFDNPLDLVFRKNTYEIGHIPSGFLGKTRPIKKKSGIEFWIDKIPLQRTGWENTSVRVYVESNVGETLEAYKLYEISHDPTCQAAGDNVDCTDYPRCSVISEYHSQQFDIDVGLNLPPSKLPPISYMKNDECETQHIHLNEPIDIDMVSHGRWSFGMNAKEYEIASYTYIVNDYEWPANTSDTYESFCGDLTSIVIYDQMPVGCAFFDSIDFCISVECDASSYVEGTLTSTMYPITDQTTINDFELEIVGTGSYLGACHEITTCRELDFSTNDALQVVDVKAIAKKAKPVPTPVESLETSCVFNHLKNDRVRIVANPQFLQYNTIWSFDGFRVTTDSCAQFIGDSCDLTYKGQSEPYLHDSAAIRQTIYTPSEIATEVSSYLYANGPDYWFNYINASDPADDGYYRVTHPSTLSGPFSTASDGAGNDFYDIDEEVGISVELTLEWYEAVGIRELDWSGPNSTKTFTDVGNVNTLEYKVEHFTKIAGPTENCLPSYFKQDGYFVTSPPARGSAVENIYIGGGRFTPTSDPGFASHETFSGCAPPGDIPESACVDDGYGPPDGKCWIVDRPDLISGSCTTVTNGMDTLDASQRICCDEEEPVYELLNWSYFDFNKTPWSGQITPTGYGNYYQVAFEFTTGFVELNYGVTCVHDADDNCAILPDFDDISAGDGPSTLVYKTATFYFPVKWGDCWTGLDARTAEWDGSIDEIVSCEDKVYLTNSMTSGTPYIEATDDVFGSGELDTNSMFTDVTIISDVITANDITITAKAYNPTWQNF